METTCYENKIASRVFIPEEGGYAASSIFYDNPKGLQNKFTEWMSFFERNESIGTIALINKSAMISKIDENEDYEFEWKDYLDDYDYNMVIEPEVVKTFQVKLKITGVTEFEPEIFLEDLD